MNQSITSEKKVPTKSYSNEETKQNESRLAMVLACIVVTILIIFVTQ